MPIYVDSRSFIVCNVTVFIFFSKNFRKSSLEKDDTMVEASFVTEAVAEVAS